MTDVPTSDLVAKLRYLAIALPMWNPDSDWRIINTAADEIERLRSEPLIWNSEAQERAEKAEARAEKFKAALAYYSNKMKHDAGQLAREILAEDSP